MTHTSTAATTIADGAAVPVWRTIYARPAPPTDPQADPIGARRRERCGAADPPTGATRPAGARGGCCGHECAQSRGGHPAPRPPPEGPHAVVHEALTRALGEVLGLARPGGTAWFAVVGGRIVLGDRALAAFAPTGPPSPPFRWSPDDHTFPEPFRCVAVPGPQSRCRPPRPRSRRRACRERAGAVLVGVGPGCCGPAGSGTGTRLGGPTPDNTEPPSAAVAGDPRRRDQSRRRPCRAVHRPADRGVPTCGAWVHCPDHAECPWCPPDAPAPGAPQAPPPGVVAPAPPTTPGATRDPRRSATARGLRRGRRPRQQGAARGAATTVPTPKAPRAPSWDHRRPSSRGSPPCAWRPQPRGLAADDEWRLELWSRALPTPPAVRGIAETLAARGGRGRTAEARRLAMAAHTLGTDCSDILRATEPPDRKRGRDD